MGQSLIPLPKAIFSEYWIKSDMSHSDAGWHIWQTVQNQKIVNKTAQWRDLSNIRACKSFLMQFAKVGEQKGI